MTRSRQAGGGGWLGVGPCLVLLLNAAALGCGAGARVDSPAPLAPAASASAASADTASRAPGEPTAEAPAPPRPADAKHDAEYYRVRSAALQREEPGELAGTDFVRFRRGRLYARSPLPTQLETTLQGELTASLAKKDAAAILDTTARIIADDAADIRGHLLRAATLRGLQRLPEADFHRTLAERLLRSMLDAANGDSFDSAWIAFSVKEEYDALRALGCALEQQALTPHGQRTFDVIEARNVGSGETLRLYFDVTELFAEEGRSMSARGRR